MGEIDNIKIYHAHIQDLEDKIIDIVRNSENFRKVIDNSDDPMIEINNYNDNDI